MYVCNMYVYLYPYLPTHNFHHTYIHTYAYVCAFLLSCSILHPYVCIRIPQVYRNLQGTPDLYYIQYFTSCVVQRSMNEAF